MEESGVESTYKRIVHSDETLLETDISRLLVSISDDIVDIGALEDAMLEKYERSGASPSTLLQILERYRDKIQLLNGDSSGLVKPHSNTAFDSLPPGQFQELAKVFREDFVTNTNIPSNPDYVADCDEDLDAVQPSTREEKALHALLLAIDKVGSTDMDVLKANKIAREKALQRRIAASLRREKQKLAQQKAAEEAAAARAEEEATAARAEEEAAAARAEEEAAAVVGEAGAGGDTGGGGDMDVDGLTEAASAVVSPVPPAAEKADEGLVVSECAESKECPRGAPADAEGMDVDEVPFPDPVPGVPEVDDSAPVDFSEPDAFEMSEAGEVMKALVQGLSGGLFLLNRLSVSVKPEEENTFFASLVPFCAQSGSCALTPLISSCHGSHSSTEEPVGFAKYSFGNYDITDCSSVDLGGLPAAYPSDQTANEEQKILAEGISRLVRSFVACQLAAVEGEVPSSQAVAAAEQCVVAHREQLEVFDGEWRKHWRSSFETLANSVERLTTLRVVLQQQCASSLEGGNAMSVDHDSVTKVSFDSFPHCGDSFHNPFDVLGKCASNFDGLIHGASTDAKPHPSSVFCTENSSKPISGGPGQIVAKPSTAAEIARQYAILKCCHTLSLGHNLMLVSKPVADCSEATKASQRAELVYDILCRCYPTSKAPCAQDEEAIRELGAALWGPHLIICRDGADALAWSEKLTAITSNCDHIVNGGGHFRPGNTTVVPYFNKSAKERFELRQYMNNDQLFQQRGVSHVVIATCASFLEDNSFFCDAVSTWHSVVLDNGLSLISNSKFGKLQRLVLDVKCRHRIVSVAQLHLGADHDSVNELESTVVLPDIGSMAEVLCPYAISLMQEVDGQKTIPCSRSVCSGVVSVPPWVVKENHARERAAAKLRSESPVVEAVNQGGGGSGDESSCGSDHRNDNDNDSDSSEEEAEKVEPTSFQNDTFIDAASTRFLVQLLAAVTVVFDADLYEHIGETVAPRPVQESEDTASGSGVTIGVCSGLFTSTRELMDTHAWLEWNGVYYVSNGGCYSHARYRRIVNQHYLKQHYTDTSFDGELRSLRASSDIFNKTGVWQFAACVASDEFSTAYEARRLEECFYYGDVRAILSGIKADPASKHARRRRRRSSAPTAEAGSVDGTVVVGKRRRRRRNADGELMPLEPLSEGEGAEGAADGKKGRRRKKEAPTDVPTEGPGLSIKALVDGEAAAVDESAPATGEKKKRRGRRSGGATPTLLLVEAAVPGVQEGDPAGGEEAAVPSGGKKKRKYVFKNQDTNTSDGGEGGSDDETSAPATKGRRSSGGGRKRGKTSDTADTEQTVADEDVVIEEEPIAVQTVFLPEYEEQALVDQFEAERPRCVSHKGDVWQVVLPIPISSASIKPRFVGLFNSERSAKTAFSVAHKQRFDAIVADFHAAKTDSDRLECIAMLNSICGVSNKTEEDGADALEGATKEKKVARKRVTEQDFSGQMLDDDKLVGCIADMYLPSSVWYQHKAIGTWDVPEVGPRAFAALVGPAHFVANVTSHRTVLGRVQRASSKFASRIFGNPIDVMEISAEKNIFANRHDVHNHQSNGDMIGLVGHEADVHLSDDVSIDNKHAEIEWNAERGSFQIKCLSFVASIYVNGVEYGRNSEPALLNSRDAVQIGHRIFFFLVATPPIYTGFPTDMLTPFQKYDASMTPMSQKLALLNALIAAVQLRTCKREDVDELSEFVTCLQESCLSIAPIHGTKVPTVASTASSAALNTVSSTSVPQALVARESIKVRAKPKAKAKAKAAKEALGPDGSKITPERSSDTATMTTTATPGPIPDVASAQTEKPPVAPESLLLSRVAVTVPPEPLTGGETGGHHKFKKLLARSNVLLSDGVHLAQPMPGASSMRSSAQYQLPPPPLPSIFSAGAAPAPAPAPAPASVSVLRPPNAVPGSATGVGSQVFKPDQM